MKFDSTSVNHGIQATKVRLIDENGTMIGVMDKQEAINVASEKGMDLILLSNLDGMPVCKIIDYGKHKYEIQKKTQKNKKKQKIVETKEIKINSSLIQSHDYNVKIKKARETILDGNKVKFSLKLRGREVLFKQNGYNLFDKITNDLADIAKIAQQHTEKDVSSGNFFCVFTQIASKN